LTAAGPAVTISIPQTTVSALATTIFVPAITASATCTVTFALQTIMFRLDTHGRSGYLSPHIPILAAPAHEKYKGHDKFSEVEYA